MSASSLHVPRSGRTDLMYEFERLAVAGTDTSVAVSAFFQASSSVVWPAPANAAPVHPTFGSLVRLMDRMDESDAGVVAQIRAGDSGAFRVLVERHSRPVFRLAYRLTGNQQDAEDVVQETFLRAFRQLKRFESRASFGTWIHRIAVNCAIDLLRGRPRPKELASLDEMAVAGAADTPDEDAIGPDRRAASAEIRRTLGLALDGLTPAERTAFVLRHFEGRSLEEIGQALGLRTSATKHSIFRAVQKMRRILEPLVT